MGALLGSDTEAETEEDTPRVPEMRRETGTKRRDSRSPEVEITVTPRSAFATFEGISGLLESFCKEEKNKINKIERYEIVKILRKARKVCEDLIFRSIGFNKSCPSICTNHK